MDVNMIYIMQTLGLLQCCKLI